MTVAAPELRTVHDHARADLARRAPTSLAAHAALVHRDDRGRPIVPARVHAEWIRMLEDRERHRWLAIVAPPGYAKSTICSIAYPAWRIGQDPTIRIGLIANTASLAFGFAQSIREAIRSPQFRDAHGDIQPDYHRGWTQDRFWVSQAADSANPTLLASGIGGPVQGQRFDEIILDDPTTLHEARSEAVMRHQRHWLTTTLLQRFPPGMRPPDGRGRMIVVLTRWSEGDLVPTLAELGFEIVTMPALGYWDRRDGIPGSEPLWPQAESREQLEAERESEPLTFELVKQGDAKALSGGRMFNPAGFQEAEPPALGEFSRLVQYVDTSGGRDQRRGDYFAHVTLGFRGEEVWVLNVYRDRLRAPQQVEKIAELFYAWSAPGLRPSRVGIEDANEGAAVYQLLEQSEHRLPLKLDKPIGDKEFRATPLANAYAARRVWHAAGARWRREFEPELQTFPEGPHDDMADAAAGAYNLAGSTRRPRLRRLR